MSSDNLQDDTAIYQQILDLKQKLGDQLIILTHHYQRREIVALGDYKGDSFDLSQKAAADAAARHIVFCGVHFMAESAKILAQPHQTVQIPDVAAGCWMADMADHVQAQRAWQEIDDIVGANQVTPIVYMNSDAEIKAFCGQRGGTVCTSSNAPLAFNWAFGQREKVFFFPDLHLGHNTAHALGLGPQDMVVWDPEKPMGGNQPEAIKRAKVILWNGYCLVHTRFTPDHIAAVRKTKPQALIVVHPECTREVVALADAVGSTSFIVNYVQQAPAGATVVVGTEINLVERLNDEFPDKTVVPLHRSLCPNMYKIDPPKLLATLESIGQTNLIEVPEAIKADARLALDRMLALAPKK